MTWKPRDYQIELLHSMRSKKRACAVWHRRCLHVDTLIRLWDGSAKRISSIQPGDEIVGLGENGLEKSIVLGSWSSGLKLTRTFSFGNNELICTDDHKIALIQRKGLEYREVYNVGKSQVPCYRGHRFSGLFCKESKWLGMMASDGSCLEDQCPSFTACIPSIKDSFINECTKLFPIDPVVDDHGTGWRIRMPSGSSGKKGSNLAKELLRRHRMIGKKSDREFPVSAWTWDENSRWKFVEGLLEGDGSIFQPKPNHLVPNPCPQISMHCGVNESFCRSLMRFMEALGVQCRYSKDKANNHQVRIYRRESVNRILHNVHVNKWGNIITETPRGAVRRWRSLGITGIKKRVKEVFPSETWDLETSTGNFFANDILVHNSGKDFCCWNLVIEKALAEIGQYYYCFPTYTQARKALWDLRDNDGNKLLDHVPEWAIEGVNNQEMKLRLKSGSLIQLVGAENPDSLRGTNPKGIVFSEYSMMMPDIWTAIAKPILTVNGGWAIFISTPRGRNHFYDMYQQANGNPDWFCSLKTIKDTGLVSPETIEAEKLEGMSEDLILQEYECSFTAGQDGLIYSQQIEEARTFGRIRHVPWDRSLPVYCAWDIGYRDATSVIAFQVLGGGEVRCINHLSQSGRDIVWWVHAVKEWGYKIETHFLPHDADSRSLQTGMSTKEQMMKLGLSCRVLERADVQDGIQMVRATFNRIWFDEKNCKYLVKALENYQKEWDGRRKVYSSRPLHNWASDSSDSFRYMVQALPLAGMKSSGRSGSDIMKQAIGGDTMYPLIR